VPTALSSEKITPRAWNWFWATSPTAPLTLALAPVTGTPSQVICRKPLGNGVAAPPLLAPPRAAVNAETAAATPAPVAVKVCVAAPKGCS